MKSHRLLIGLMFSLAFLTVITATVRILALDVLVGKVFALILLPFALVSLYYSVFSRQTVGVLYAMISSLLAFVVMINELFLSYFTDIFYLAALAVYFVTVLLLFHEISPSHIGRNSSWKKNADRKSDKTAAALADAAKRVEAAEKKKAKSSGNQKKGTKKAAAKSAAAKSRPKLVASMNAETTAFHRTSCQVAKRIKRSNRLYFSSRKEALDKNYSPCKICRP